MIAVRFCLYQWITLFSLMKGLFCICDLTGSIESFAVSGLENFDVFAITDRMRIICDGSISAIYFGTHDNPGKQLSNGPIFQIWRPHQQLSGVFIHICDITNSSSSWNCTTSTSDLYTCKSHVDNVRVCSDDVIAFKVSRSANVRVAVTNARQDFTIYTTAIMPFSTLNTGFLGSYNDGSPYVSLDVSDESTATCTPFSMQGPQGFLDFNTLNARFPVHGYHIVATGLTFSDNGFIREVKVGASGFSGVLAVELWSPTDSGSYVLQTSSVEMEFTRSTISQSCLQTPIEYSSSYLVGFQVLEGYVDIGASTHANWVQLFRLEGGRASSTFAAADWTMTAQLTSPLIYVNTECSVEDSTQVMPTFTTMTLSSLSSSSSILSTATLILPTSSNTAILISSTSSSSSNSVTLISLSEVTTGKSSLPEEVSILLSVSSMEISVNNTAPNSGLPVEAVVAIAIIGFVAGALLTIIIISVLLCIKSRGGKRRYRIASSNVYFSADKKITESTSPLKKVSDSLTPGTPVIMQSNPSYEMIVDGALPPVKTESDSKEIVMISNPSYSLMQDNTKQSNLTITGDYTYDYIQPTEW